jgi:hypothetical protein
VGITKTISEKTTQELNCLESIQGSQIQEWLHMQPGDGTCKIQTVLVREEPGIL